MERNDRAALLYRIDLASKHSLAKAVKSLVATEAKAKIDEKDHPEDPSLGWFADGLDTALNVLAAELGVQTEGS